MTDATPIANDASATAEPSLRIFISYRRDDSSGDARLLYERLALRFGADKVFLDVVNLQPGMDWLAQTDAYESTCAVFLVLIGARWEETIAERRSLITQRPPDLVVREIAFALNPASAMTVIPVLIDNAPMPPEEVLPRAIRELASRQGVNLRHADLDRDLDNLIALLGQVPAPAPVEPVQPTPPPPAPTPTPTGPDEEERNGRPSVPSRQHYERVLRHLVKEGSLAFVLGSRVNAAAGEERHRSGGGRRPPDAEELAVELARRFDLTWSSHVLASVAQQVCVTSGRPDLYRTLQELLQAAPQPVGLHHFLAGVPSRVARLTGAKRCPLIVTTNYDSALERAFDAAHEPYDLALYMASGRDEGRFVHFPFDGTATPILTPNEYAGFPIDEYGELTRTIIVKIHGTVDGTRGEYSWKRNYIITEDQYIGYLSSSAIESLVPIQILDKLTGSHWLVLGYPMRDWALRVFINRVCRGQPFDARSWAVEENPSPLEEDYWTHVGVEMLAYPLVDYLQGLGAYLDTYDQGSG